MIAPKPYRIGIVGASSLAGKELADTLPVSSLAASEVLLFDDEALAGQLVSAGDEPTFIQKIDRDSFTGLDFVFFTGDAAITTKYWKAARIANASIIDMTYALETEPGVVVRAPWANAATDSSLTGTNNTPDFTTAAVVSAHPAALMLLLAASRVHAKLPLHAISATIFEPASEHGQDAMDELHQQTVALLSFKNLPREQYEAQVAFNLLTSVGEAAKINLPAAKARIATHYANLSQSPTPELALQLIQAPVFHGYVASILIELTQPATISEVERSLQGTSIDIVSPDSDSPSNISAAGQSDILATVRRATDYTFSPSNVLNPAAVDVPTAAATEFPPAITPSKPSSAASLTPASDILSTRFWLWLAADNLKLTALNAIACANELSRLRPQGKVQ